MLAPPPCSLLLVHGAGSGAWVYESWSECFPGIAVVAVDLHEGLDVAAASHADFDPVAVYGPFPPGMRARPESSRAHAERKRGIFVPSIPWPSLVVYGDDFREERGQAVARLYGSDELDSTAPTSSISRASTTGDLSGTCACER